VKNEKIYVTKTFMPPFEEYIEEIRDLWDTSWITNMGAKHAELEEALKSVLGVPAVSLMSNGHMALELSLAAMHLEGDVITTPFTFASTTHAIARNNLTPVFCDIRPDDFTMDASKIEDLITDRTCAILPVHVYGNVCDVDAIDKIAKAHGLKVIYDAAHAFGVKVGDRGIGSFGDASIFSFHATKVFHTVEGGAVCYSSPELGQRLYELKNFGIMDETTVTGIGANAKMSEFHAAMGLVNLRYHDANVKRRQAICNTYTEHLRGIQGLRIPEDTKDPLTEENLPELRTPEDAKDPLTEENLPELRAPSYTTEPLTQKNYAYYPVVIEKTLFGADRDEVAKRLAAENIYVRKYFYPLTSDYQCYRELLPHVDTPVADHIAASVITLPLSPSMEIEDVVRICDLIKTCRR